ncbi:MAG: hypothetical protein U1E73_05390 [Planctomycetota bacterium]
MYHTFATAVWSDGVTLFVAGWGNDATLAQSAALLWTRPLGANTLASNTTLGQGCGSLRMAATTRPVMAGSWNLAAVGAPSTTTFGVTWLGVADPGIIDLAYLGLPDCQQRASIDVLFGPWTPVSGRSTLAMAVPANLPWLIGLHAYVQSAAFTIPAPNPFGAITSNGIVGTIGDH